MSFDRIEARNVAREEYIQQWRDTYSAREKALQGRKIQFLKDPSNRMELGLILGGGALSGAAAGAVVGGIVGGVCGTPGGPPGVALGAAIGIPVGGAVGILVGGVGAYKRLRPRYIEFCRTELGKEFAGKLSAFLKDDNEFLDDFTCPITLMPVLDGVRTPDGRLYEREAIEEAIDRGFTNPLTREPLTKSDLVADNEASYTSAKEFVKFLKEKRKDTELATPNLMEGYDKLIKDIREWGISIGNKNLIVLQKKLSTDQISYEEFQQKNSENIQKYYNL